MADLTLVVSRDHTWKVYRIRTLSSEYHLAIFAGAAGRRPCALLRGLSRGLGQLIDLQDSAPLIGGQSLFTTPAAEWVGKSLEIGTATTSPVQAVEEERDAETIASLTRAVARTFPEPVDTRAPTQSMERAPEWASAGPGRHRLFVGKDTHKFSAAHMTVFADGTKERLHGHNFQVAVALTLAPAGLQTLVDLGMIKRALGEQCAAWDQRLLLAAQSPQLGNVRRAGGECEFRLCGQRYVAPDEEVILLPIANVTVEMLAEAFAHAFLERIGPELPRGSVTHLEVTITESDGQGSTFEMALRAT